jgi:hypothetical protein
MMPESCLQVPRPATCSARAPGRLAGGLATPPWLCLGLGFWGKRLQKAVSRQQINLLSTACIATTSAAGITRMHHGGAMQRKGAPDLAAARVTVAGLLAVLCCQLSVAKAAAPPLSQSPPLVRERSQWRYWAEGPHTSPAARDGWMQPGFNDHGWPLGAGVFGFGDGYLEPFGTVLRAAGGVRGSNPVGGDACHTDSPFSSHPTRTLLELIARELDMGLIPSSCDVYVRRSPPTFERRSSLPRGWPGTTP